MRIWFWSLKNTEIKTLTCNFEVNLSDFFLGLRKMMMYMKMNLRMNHKFFNLRMNFEASY